MKYDNITPWSLEFCKSHTIYQFYFSLKRLLKCHYLFVAKFRHIMQKSVHSIIYNVLSLEFNDDETRERGNAVRCVKSFNRTA